MKQPKRMEIWFAELGVHPGTSVQEGCRPVLVISNDKGNEYAETVTVAPLTSKIKKPWLPTHLMVTEENIEMNDFYDKPFRNAMLFLSTSDKTALMRLLLLHRKERITEVEADNVQRIKNKWHVSAST